MSEDSFRNWYRVKGWARQMLSAFALCLTQTEEECSRFVALGAKPVRCVGNLKYAANPLPADELALSQMKLALGDRPVWLMASTHRGEEEMVLAAHRKLRLKFPHMLTILVPRHASRGDEVAIVLGKQKVALARRSKNETITAETEIYLADTMGELGLFFRLCPVMCMGGSFAWGGHNPIEPAQLGCAIILGPRMENFAAMAKEFLSQHAAVQIQNENEIGFMVEHLLTHADERARYVLDAQVLADRKRHLLEDVLTMLRPWLDIPTRKAA
jgi:3-deoxy-D-manno-octulosonic-acid transferase